MLRGQLFDKRLYSHFRTLFLRLYSPYQILKHINFNREFGDYHTKAVDETWYKTAILQHQIDPKSFVYSVPHSSDPIEESEIKVTASHAIFPRDGGIEAPGSVVGFQFSQNLMYERFMQITSKVNVSFFSSLKDNLFIFSHLFIFSVMVV